MRTFRTLLIAVAATAALAACGTAANPRAASTPAPAVATTEGAPAATANIMVPVANLVATARASLAVYAAAGASKPIATVPAHTHFGSPTAFYVHAWQGRSGSWLQVALPTRPNGSTGFVRAQDVSVATLDHRVDVDIAARRLRVYDAGGAVVVDTATAVGSPQNPTPTGAFFVTDVIATNSSTSAYGPFAIGLSAHSNTLSEFEGGDGEIGIHGTNNPSSIGNAVSHGCVRVPNAIATQLAQILTPGTPVSIH